MADNSLTSGGDNLATDDLATINGGATSGVKVQRTKVGFGSDSDLRDVDATHGLPPGRIAQQPDPRTAAPPPEHTPWPNG